MEDVVSPSSSGEAEEAQVGDKRRRDHDQKNELPPRKRRSRSQKKKLTTFITEMLENGDLRRFIVQTRDHNERVPNVVLWRFFLCCKSACWLFFSFFSFRKGKTWTQRLKRSDKVFELTMLF